MTVHNTKTPPHVNHLGIHSRTNLHMQITAHTIIQKFPPNDQHTPLHYYVSVQSYIYASLAQEKNYCFIHKTPEQIYHVLQNNIRWLAKFWKQPTT